MAPLARGRSRGSGRGRGSNRGRGRGSSTIKTGKGSTFYPTRVEEQVYDSAVLPEENRVLSDDEQSLSAADDASSDEDLEIAQPTANSYNTLLQSLNANVPIGFPQRKRRKIDREVADKNLRIKSHGEPSEVLDESVTVDHDAVHEESDPDEANDPDEVEEDVEVEVEEIAAGDPYVTHIDEPDELELVRKIKNIKATKFKTVRVALPSAVSCSLSVPDGLEVDENVFKAPPKSTQDFQLKRKLERPAADLLPVLSNVQQDLAGPLFTYTDLLYTDRTPDNADALRKISCLHLMNHLFKTRDRVIKNNGRLARDAHEVDLELRDQGFTRPKVLVIVPTRQSCVKWVENIVSLCGPEQQENRKRFQDSYSQTEDALSEEKPDDFRELFGGNDDDMFRVGLKFTRKTIKYFAQFYNSDIIFASPLGLRMAIGAEDDKKQDHDFLSSIEIVVVDHASALTMQNWEHNEFIFEHLNLQPKEAHGCDFSRVRNWYLDGNARYLRQTIIFSAFNFPALNRLYLHQMLNVAGKIKIAKQHDGAMLELGNSIKQTFSRFEYIDPVSEPDNRFTYFTTAIVPILAKYSTHSAGGKQGILVYLPSYADFVRVRNHLATSSVAQNISFGSISEYTSVREVARARSHFFTGRHSVLLYTERAHHFRRYHLRGVKRIFMYGLPENPIFYKEVVGGFLGATISEGKLSAGEASVRSLFSKLDVLKLERIGGSKRMSSMIREKGGDTFDFL